MCRVRAPAMSAVESKIIIFMLATILFSGRCRALALVLLTSFAIGQSTADAASRTDVELNSDWRFQQGDRGAGYKTLETAVLDSTLWQKVSLPHCWGWEDAQKGKQYYRGPGWYWRVVTATPSAGRRYFLRFEAAGS